MTNRLRESLEAQPWWHCRYRWGLAVCQSLVIEWVWYSRFSMSEIGDLDEL